MFARKSILIIISRLFHTALQFVALMFITRNLGAEIYGSITYTVAFVGMLNFFADIGYDYSHQKNISGVINLSDGLSTYIVIKILLIITTIIIILFSIWSSSILFNYRVFPYDLILLYLFIIYYVLMDLSYLCIHTFYGLIKTATAELILLVEKIIRVPLIIIISLGSSGSVELALAYVAGAFVCLIVGITMLTRLNIKITKPIKFAQYTLFAIPMAGVIFVNIIYLNIDKIIIGMFWGPSVVGFYAAGQSLLLFLMVIGSAVSTIIFPTVSKLFHSGKLSEIINISQMSEKYSIFLALPIVIIILVFPEIVSTLVFGNEFINSASPMRFLSICVLFNILALIYINQLNAIGKPRTTLKITSLALLTNILLMLVLVPSQLFGIQLLGASASGAALANLIYMVITYILTKTACNHYIGKHSGYLIRTIITIIIISAIFIILSSLLTPDKLLFLLLYIILSYILVFTMFIFMRIFKQQDIRFMLSLLNTEEMLRCIKDDLKEKP